MDGWCLELHQNPSSGVRLCGFLCWVGITIKGFVQQLNKKVYTTIKEATSG
ncbi:hypothetical protein CARG_03355 [Corynebacterium argentoratense DSM 44202]|uniref:Uncharacterized protein n=1 Tax=Corynebacterium argentoratense DSM 44202 TaxID=1348662 RepID=U3GYW7_9CORY|nr:hypothetical protein CARG_03355 [Corynebacterium argentoratense DSM 44202]